jgi:hypothetical protein
MSATDISDPNPLLAKVCVQLDIMMDCDEVSGEPINGSEHEETCGRELVWEQHGDEIVYMCVEHGWQATVFAEGSGE